MPVRIIRLITRFHHNGQLIIFFSTTLGKFILWLLASFLLLRTNVQSYYLVPPFLAIYLILPKIRNIILSIACLIFLYLRLHPKFNFLPFTPIDYEGITWFHVIAAEFLIISIFYLFYCIAKSYNQLPKIIQRYPILWLNALFLVLILIYSLAKIFFTDFKIFYLFISLISFINWKCGYLLLSGKRFSIQKSHFTDHLFYLDPLYGGSHTPHGKGFDYLQHASQKNIKDITSCQLSGIRLLIIVQLLMLIEVPFNIFFFGKHYEYLPSWLNGISLNLPSVSNLIQENNFKGNIFVYWVSIYAELFQACIKVAIWGHKTVGCLRLFGFNVLRNTYHPLLSRSIIDFWGRYNYYFKELLVQFFFVPTYLNFFRDKPKIRLFIAVFSAAFLGNLYFHLLFLHSTEMFFDIKGIYNEMSSRTLYSFLLAVGIFFSMLKQRKNRKNNSISKRFLKKISTTYNIFFVWTFYALIHIWVTKPFDVTFGQRYKFFLKLFGI